MHKELLLATFILYATEMLVTTHTTPPHCAHYDMKQFLNTPEAIWTYKTTYTRNLSCEMNVMESITPSEIIYKRKFVFDQIRNEVLLRGMFLGLYPERMTVMTRGGRPVCAEILLYLAGDLSCAVIKVPKSASNCA
uniref:Lipocalin n=1 Tax=Rhipicephalus appendiculatus TaxID=34631 RepID=A0A131YCZ9_RHIAP